MSTHDVKTPNDAPLSADAANPLTDRSQIATSRLEIDIPGGQTINCSVKANRSSIYNIGNIYFLESFEDATLLYDKIQKSNGSNPGSLSPREISESKKTTDNNAGNEQQSLESIKIIDTPDLDFYNTGYLIVFILKKIYARVKVQKFKDNRLKVASLEDFVALGDGLKMFFQVNPGCGADAYDELITYWKNEDKFDSLPITPVGDTEKTFGGGERAVLGRARSHSRIPSGNFGPMGPDDMVKTSKMQKAPKDDRFLFESQTKFDSGFRTGTWPNQKEPSVISLDTRRVDQSSFGRTFFGADQELIVFKVSEFEMKLRKIEYENYDKKIENINEEMEDIKESLQQSVFNDDPTPSFIQVTGNGNMISDVPFDTIHNTNNHFLKHHRKLESSIVNPNESIDQTWDKIFSLGGSKPGPNNQLATFNGNPNPNQNDGQLALLRTKLEDLRETKENLLMQKMEFDGPILSLMIGQMGGFIKRNKRKLNILKKTYQNFF
jgi:hypothetical protein